MNGQQLILRFIYVFTAILGCSAGFSCEKMELTSSKDYIGPSQTAEPNIADAAKFLTPIIEYNDQNAGPVIVTITDALLMALENNKSLAVERFNPQIQRTFVQRELALFDPSLLATVSQSNTRSETMPRPGLGSFSETERDFTAEAAIREFLPTGTNLALTGSTDRLTGSFLDEAFISSRIGLTATQSLLRGLGPRVNLASVNQAKIDVRTSQYELRGFTESLAAQIEETYWNYALAGQRIKIFEDSLSIAKKQLEETQERINLGVLAKSEIYTAEAEVALREELLINARSNLVQVRLNLARLLNARGGNILKRDIILDSTPAAPNAEPEDVELHVNLAMRMRPELNQAKLLLLRDELELVKTRNGLLPRLDLFATIGKTGFSDSFSKSFSRITNEDDYDAMIGAVFEYPPINRAARAANYRATFTKQQHQEALNNLIQLIEVDVRSAHQELIRSHQQVSATKVSRKLQQEKLNVEIEKFRVGTSTSLFVAQAERDYLLSQIAEVNAVISTLNAYVELYRMDGSLLARRGIASPGAEPVQLPSINFITDADVKKEY